MGGNHSHKPAVFDENEEGKRARGAATVRHARASAWLPASISRVPGPLAPGFHPGNSYVLGPPSGWPGPSVGLAAGSESGTRSLPSGEPEGGVAFGGESGC